MAFAFRKVAFFSYDRATIKGVKFCATRLEELKKAKDSVVMILDEGSPTGRSFGRAKRFLRTLYPGTDKVFDLVDANWYANCSERQCMNQAINCPVVKKTYQTGSLQQFWPLACVLPTNICLAPYILPNGEVDDTFWQVLSSAPDFTTRDVILDRSSAP